MEVEFNNIYQRLISGKEKLALVGLGYVGMPIAEKQMSLRVACFSFTFIISHA